MGELQTSASVQNKQQLQAKVLCPSFLDSRARRHRCGLRLRWATRCI